MSPYARAAWAWSVDNNTQAHPTLWWSSTIIYKNKSGKNRIPGIDPLMWKLHMILSYINFHHWLDFLVGPILGPIFLINYEY